MPKTFDFLARYRNATEMLTKFYAAPPTTADQALHLLEEAHFLNASPSKLYSYLQIGAELNDLFFIDSTAAGNFAYEPAYDRGLWLVLMKMFKPRALLGRGRIDLYIKVLSALKELAVPNKVIASELLFLCGIDSLLGRYDAPLTGNRVATPNVGYRGHA